MATPIQLSRHVVPATKVATFSARFTWVAGITLSRTLEFTLPLAQADDVHAITAAAYRALADDGQPLRQYGISLDAPSLSYRRIA